MTTDPIVEDVRSARRQVEQEAANAGLTLGAFLRKNQKSATGRLVRRNPVYVQQRKTA